MQTTMSVATLFVLLFGLGGGVPLGVPPAEEDPLMARVAPPKCLFYTTWAGTAEPNPQSGNQTEQLLAEPEVQHLAAEIERMVNQALRLAAEKAPPERAALVRDLSEWWRRILTRPAALFVSDVELKRGKPEIHAGAVFQLGEDAGKFEAMLLKHLRRALGGAVEEVKIEGETAYRIQLGPDVPAITWGVTEGYLGIGIGQGTLEAIVERSEAEPPEWLTRVRERLPIERRSTLTYIGARQIRELIFSATKGPNVREIAGAMGLENLAWIGSTTGLDETGFVNRAFLAIDGEPQGLLALLEKPLTREDLGPIPRDATAAVAARFDSVQLWKTVLSIAEAADPRAHQELLRNVGRLERETGIELRQGVLEPLGEVWRFYLAPNQGGLMFTGLTAVIDVKDPDRLAQTLRQFRDMVVRMSDRRNGPRIEQFTFAGREIQFFIARQKGFPLAPAWILTDDRLVIGLFPQTVKAYLSREEGSESLAAVAEVARLFESNQAPNKLAFVNTREVFESTYPLLMMGVMGAQVATAELQRQGFDIDISALPSAGAIGKHLIPSVTAVERTDAGIEVISRQTIPGGNIGSSAPVAVALLLPAVQAAREAARRAQSMNNMKQIGLALHNYHDTYRHFPAQYSTGPEGKPLLSWRVHILPYLEQAPLYEEFRLDEPWDSEHNRKLIARMPPVYRVPGRDMEGKTHYLAASGEAAIFTGGKPGSIREIIDGTSNTIAVVEANDEAAVTWTKPEDLDVGMNDLISRLVGVRPKGFLALLADGSVRFVDEKIDRDTLKALFTRRGGEAAAKW